ncbi:MAG TPA: DNA-binding protein [Candidatus Limnocylindria bacterium]|nr:DNA-binding protein [Candidatus Limnocylindria bacterium]
MAQLIVQNIEEEVVQALETRARWHGVSVEEELRQILRVELLGQSSPQSFKSALMAIPDAGEDGDFERGEQVERPVAL